MFQSTIYRLEITADSHYDLMGRPTVGYQFVLQWDDRVLRQGYATSPEALGRVIGEGCRDAAESYERQTAADSSYEKGIRGLR